jgi:aspartyl-tRNA(Asn)/glutamyl-tRNA(Gln) amidotransferase subunit C
VANLTKLKFPENEIYEFTKTFGKIINFVEQLEEVDTTGVAFTSNIVDSINVLREDVAEPSENRNELMKNVPEKENGLIKVPAILSDEEA